MTKICFNFLLIIEITKEEEKLHVFYLSRKRCDFQSIDTLQLIVNGLIETFACSLIFILEKKMWAY